MWPPTVALLVGSNLLVAEFEPNATAFSIVAFAPEPSAVVFLLVAFALTPTATAKVPVAFAFLPNATAEPSQLLALLPGGNEELPFPSLLQTPSDPFATEFVPIAISDSLFAVAFAP